MASNSARDKSLLQLWEKEEDRKKMSSSKAPKTSRQIQQWRQKFVTALEKPTKIYSLLSKRQLVAPVFLNRNLLYMKFRMSRSNKARASFKLSAMLDKKLREQKQQNKDGIIDESDYLDMNILGYFDEHAGGQNVDGLREVTVRVIVKRTDHQMRNDATSPSHEFELGTLQVDVNPSDTKYAQRAALALPTQLLHFQLPVIKSYSLKFDMNVQTKGGGNVMLSSELPLCERDKCSIVPGDYQLLMHKVQDKTPFYQLSATGCRYLEKENCGTNQWKQCPYLDVELNWSQSKEKLQEAAKARELAVAQNVEPEEQPADSENLGQENPQPSQAEQQIVEYVFVNEQMMLRCVPEIMHPFSCPWCKLCCGNLYSLLKHLNLCHPRFTCLYKEMADVVRIEVMLNACFDASYAGNPSNLIAQPQLAAGRQVQYRAVLSEVIVCHPKHQPPNLMEFLKPMKEGQPSISGHNRTYFCHVTGLPLTSGQEREDHKPDVPEKAPEWLYKIAELQMDDFADVNDGEKEIMKLWNQHMLQNRFVADCQIGDACMSFIKNKGTEIVSKKIYGNFIYHLTCLFDFNLLNPQEYYKTVQALQELAAQMACEMQAVNNSKRQRDSEERSQVETKPSPDCEPIVTVPVATNIVTVPVTTSIVTVPVATNTVTVPVTTSIVTVPVTTSIVTVPVTTNMVTVPVTTNIVTVPVTTSIVTVPVTTNIVTVPVTTNIVTVPVTTSIVTVPVTTSKTEAEAQTDAGAVTNKHSLSIVPVKRIKLELTRVEEELPYVIPFLLANNKEAPNKGGLKEKN